MKFEIEWKSSHYHSDGRRRSRPKPSIFHGWIVKWRATFSGNEPLRTQGIREMREAKALQEYKRQRKAAKRAKKGPARSGLFSLFGSSNAKKRKPHRPATLTRGSQSSRGSTRGSLSRRPTGQSSRHPSYSSRRDVVRMKSSRK
ncbi:hypothetical protein K503DRAFT_764898 [Rhizopogon vinicolor AM-OR11-026]|uniref:Uncharacterized protein n=1 Tax=Rhizopogon vinicolor AM-OR11-026 TaxID=1314800 RepID=A0A1B7NI19_9AGAM|nr:hypothetical protein K503DRAFT_764898 [Rhizopogon vinicolor AM-OR11-026]